MQREKTNTRFEVEVITEDGFWAQYGPQLPDLINASSQNDSGTDWRRLIVCCAGALFSACLHVLLFGPMLLGSAAHLPYKHRYLTEGAAASGESVSTGEFSSVLLFPDDSIVPPDQTADDWHLETQNVTLPNTLDAAETPALGSNAHDQDSDAPVEAAGDAVGHAMLFGRYLGQIKARIERAWEYPAMSPAEQFDCQVQIKQDNRGDVREVTLQRCGDDPAWQISLVQAIQQASPLSAPPNEAVFSEMVTLRFSARPTPALTDATKVKTEPSSAGIDNGIHQ